MERKPNITWRHFEPTPKDEEHVQQGLQRLERFFDHILRCEVAIDAPHGHQANGSPYHVRIDITVPGHELVINRDPGDDNAHADLHVAIRDAFKAAERLLKRKVAHLRHDVKSHGARDPWAQG